MVCDGVVCEWGNHIAVFGGQPADGRSTRSILFLSSTVQLLNQSSLRSLQTVSREVSQLLLGLDIDHITRTHMA